MCTLLRPAIPGMEQQAPKTVKFRMPTAENLIPIRLDLEIDNVVLKDAFTWNADAPDADVPVFAQRLVAEKQLPLPFLAQITQAVQAQVADFRSYREVDMSVEERVLPLRLDVRVGNILVRDQFLWDTGDLTSDPERFARRLCADLDIQDRRVAPAISVAIREQLYEIAKAAVSGRESRSSKKARQRGTELSFWAAPPRGPAVASSTALSYMRHPSGRTSILRRKNDVDAFEPQLELLSDKEVEALDAKDQRNSRLKRRQEEKDDAFIGGRYSRN